MANKETVDGKEQKSSYDHSISGLRNLKPPQLTIVRNRCPFDILELWDFLWIQQ
jgi:hypothetical protein